MKDTCTKLLALAKAATPICSDKDGNYYRPVFTSEDGASVLWQAAESVPMSRFDMDFYNESLQTISALCERLIRCEDALEWYGFKMVPDCLNEGRTEISTALGKRARQALELEKDAKK